MSTTYQVIYSVPAVEAPGLFEHRAIEVTRPCELTKSELIEILQDQDLIVVDFKPLRFVQIALFFPDPESQAPHATPHQAELFKTF